MRKKIVAGNWKMNTSFEDACELACNVNKLFELDTGSADQVILFPPMPYLIKVSQCLTKGEISTGAQNCHAEDAGAYTGEVSAHMLISCGVNHVLIGHSERRAYFGEDNKFLAAKVDAALKHGLAPIYCCGELLEDRKRNDHFTVVGNQLSEGLFHLSPELFSEVVVAYEPVWAIGTGETATAGQAQEMHAFIRSLVLGKYGSAIANDLSILYGGSCKPDNAREIFAQPDVDGGLIGGAALNALDFNAIVQSF